VIVLVMLLTSQLKAVPTQNTSLLLIDELQANPAATLEQALQTALLTVDDEIPSPGICRHVHALRRQRPLPLLDDPTFQRRWLPNLCLTRTVSLNRAFSVWRRP